MVSPELRSTGRRGGLRAGASFIIITHNMFVS